VVALVVVDVIGAERAARGDFTEDPFGEAALAGVEAARPSAGSAGARAVCGVWVGPRFDWKCDQNILLGR